LTPKIKTQEVEVFFRQTRKMRSFVKKTGMPEGSELPSERASWESFGKIETPL